MPTTSVSTFPPVRGAAPKPRSPACVLLLCSVFVTLGWSEACAQEVPIIRRSQHGSVMQRVADAIVTVEYNRPVARGRELFGSLVPWGVVWTPGADTATTISLSKSVRINGKLLAAGTYSLWSEPQPERWTIIFNRVQPVFHTRYPAGQDVLRVESASRTGAHMETLAFYFPVVDGAHAELVMHWGTVVVPIELDVP